MTYAQLFDTPASSALFRLTFKVPSTGGATPYDTSLKKLPNYYFDATGAAGLYTTIDDLAAFARASLNRPGPGIHLPLSTATISLMQKRTTVEKPDPSATHWVTTWSHFR